jgi:hypothetical protein
LWVEGVAVRGGDVGRVGDDRIERGAGGGERFEQIGFNKADAAGEVVGRGVGGGDFEGGGGDVRGGYLRVRKVMGEGEGEGS